jgi:NADH:ubiquinone oxidoreductase subunit 2 (subunit N)
MELKLTEISDSAVNLLPELILTTSLITSIIIGLILTKNRQAILHALALVTYLVTFLIVIQRWPSQPISLFGGMLRLDDFSSFFKLLFLSGGFLTITHFNKEKGGHSI